MASLPRSVAPSLVFKSPKKEPTLNTVLRDRTTSNLNNVTEVARPKGGGGSSRPTPTPTPITTTPDKPQVTITQEVPKPQPVPTYPSQVGGYYVNPTTGQGYSYAEPPKDSNLIRTATVEDIQRRELTSTTPRELTIKERNALLRVDELKRVAEERGRGFTRLEAERFLGGSEGISNLRNAFAKGFTPQTVKEYVDQTFIVGKEGVKEYNKEIGRIQSVTPREEYLQVSTGKTFRDKQIVNIGDYEFSSTPYKVYVDPDTNRPILDVGEYYKEKRIPTTATDKREIGVEEFREILSEPQLFDIKTLREKGVRIGDGKTLIRGETKPSESIQEVYGSDKIVDSILFNQDRKRPETFVEQILRGDLKQPIEVRQERLGKTFIEEYEPSVLSKIQKRFKETNPYLTSRERISDLIRSGAINEIGDSALGIPPLDINVARKDFNRVINLEGEYFNIAKQNLESGELGKIIQRSSNRKLDFLGGIISSVESNFIAPVVPTTLKELSIVSASSLISPLGRLATAQFIFRKPIVETVSTTIDNIIPRSNSGFNLRGIPSQVGRGALFLASSPLTGVAFASDIGENLLKNPSGTLKDIFQYTIKNPYEIITVARGAKVSENIQVRFLEKAKLKVPEAEFLKDVKDYSRQRATLILKDDLGNYVFGKTRAGEIISIGGGIEKGQSPRRAVLAELKQETGLSLKDIEGFKEVTKLVTPEETFIVFEGRLKSGRKVTPSSDLKSIVYFNQAQLSNILSRYESSPLFVGTRKGRFRGYEAEILRLIEKEKIGTPEQRLLTVDTPYGEVFIGTQSRYNVPAKRQLEYLDSGELLLISGTPDPAVFTNIGLNKKFEVLGSKSKRGAVKGIYVQPPVSPKRPLIGYLGISYTELFKNIPSEISNVRVGRRKPTAFIFKEKLPSPNLSPTPKTLKGSESEFVYTVGTIIQTKGRATRVAVQGKKLFLQPTEALRGIEGEKVAKLLGEGDKGSLRKASEITGVDYLESKTLFVSPEILTSFGRRSTRISEKPIRTFERRRATTLENKRSFVENRKITKESNRGYFSEREVRTLELPRPFKEEIKSPLRLEKLRKSSETQKLFRTPVKVRRVMGQLDEEKNRRLKKVPTFDVLIKKKGKFISVGKDLTKGQAYTKLSNTLLTDISRTGKLVSTGRTKELFVVDEVMKPEERLFRQYKIVRGQKKLQPDTFIQRASANLQSYSEKEQLKQARELKKLITF
jgi:hypothetical protein